MKRKHTVTLAATGLALMISACSADAGSASSVASQAQSIANQAQSAASQVQEQVQEALQNVSAETLYEAISSSVSLPDMAKIDPAFNYGISTELCDSFVFYRTKEVTQADTIAIFSVKDASDVETIRTQLETAKSFDVDSADGYNPETFEMFSESQIKTLGNIVFWIVSQDAAQIEQLINGAK